MLDFAITFKADMPPDRIVRLTRQAERHAVDSWVVLRFPRPLAGVDFTLCSPSRRPSASGSGHASPTRRP